MAHLKPQFVASKSQAGSLAVLPRLPSHSVVPQLINARPLSYRTDSPVTVCARALPTGTPQPSAPKGKSLAKRLQAPEIKEAHKVFDEVVIIVKAGDGGQGEIIESGKGRWVENLKYKPGGSQAKKIWLPASEPADGADGADVVLVCDPAYDNLLHLHSRKQYTGPRGANGNPSAGSAGPKRNKSIKKAVTPPFEIPVPPGTVVKRKGTGQLIGEILAPGDRLLVAKGGLGGAGVTVPSRQQRLGKQARQMAKAQAEGTEIVAVDDVNWKQDAAGAPGQQLSLHLLMRVVADVGIVGLPNAGKSSLLKSMTNARPDIAPYPFTTLMPNLGVLSSGGPKSTVLADLPGLIEGAHEGKGLGRMFLRHLRRTRALLHVIDASGPDPATDYCVVREELRMYNPDYCARPHVVVLNKIDLLEGGIPAAQALMTAVLDAADGHCREWPVEEVKALPPAAVVATSAATGDGLGELNRALAHCLQPSCLQDLSNRGSAATLRLLPPIVLQPAETAATPANNGAASEQPTVQAEVAASQTLQFFNSKVQGHETWSGTQYVVSKEDSSDSDEEGNTAADPDDEYAWLLGLSDEQLAKLADQDDRRCSSRESLAVQAGTDPYAHVRQEDILGDLYAVPASIASGSEGVQTSNQLSAIDTGDDKQLGLQQSKRTAGVAAEQQKDDRSTGNHGDEDDEGDEWVELTQEELGLLEFLDKYEAEEQNRDLNAEAQSLETADPEAADSGPSKDTSDVQEADEADLWLLGLSEEELEKLADKSEEGW